MKRLIIGSSALVVLALSAEVYAAVAGSDGKIHGCYVPPAGTIHVIDFDAGARCRPGEAPLEWPVASSTGQTCPAGATGPFLRLSQ
jgi:hypothetical protein